MNLVVQSQNMEEYLKETEIVNFSESSIKKLTGELFHQRQSEIEKIQVAFHFVRDEIAHSRDIEGERVTCTASDVFAFKEGICYAKSHLLAALLRSQGIPTGFCYQRLTLFESTDQFCIHALNAVYIHSLQRWYRLDARGNKKGVDAQFSLTEENLAFSVNENIGEIDYPTIYTDPNTKTLDVLKTSTNAMDMYLNKLPTTI